MATTKVTTNVIADDAVTQAKVADDAIGADQLAASAVVTASIVDDNVTQAKIADDAVGADQLASNAVVTASIVNDAVTSDKLGAEYTSAEAVSSAATITLDTDAYDVFTWTVGHTANIDFTNVLVGKVKTLVVTGGGGSYALTLRNINGSSGTFNLISGTYTDPS